VPEQIEVLNHRGENLTTKDEKDEKEIAKLILGSAAAPAAVRRAIAPNTNADAPTN
jgi:hypothetical protein